MLLAEEEWETDCECCGKVEACACDLDTVSGLDSETGPWEERVCFLHDRRV